MNHLYNVWELAEEAKSLGQKLVGTNSTFVYQAPVNIPTILASFAAAIDGQPEADAAYILINSDESMIIQERNAALKADKKWRDVQRKGPTADVRAQVMYDAWKLAGISIPLYVCVAEIKTPYDELDTIVENCEILRHSKYGYGLPEGQKSAGIIVCPPGIKQLVAHPRINSKDPYSAFTTPKDVNANEVFTDEKGTYIHQFGSPQFRIDVVDLAPYMPQFVDQHGNCLPELIPESVNASDMWV